MDNLWNSLKEMIFRMNVSILLEKMLLSVVVLVAVAISLNVFHKIIDGIFNDNKPGIEVREARRLVTLNNVVKTFTRASVWIVAIIMILGQYMDVGSLIAVAGIGTVAIGFGARGIVEDVMSGFVIIFENQFCVGDYITIDETHYGIVESIGIRTTTIREFTGGLFIIHNGKIDRLVNFSKGHIKAVVDVGVSNKENINNVIDIINAVCSEVFESHEDLFNTPPEVVGVTQMDPTGMTIRVISDEDASAKAKAEIILRQKIKEAFDLHKIEIPSTAV